MRNSLLLDPQLIDGLIKPAKKGEKYILLPRRILHGLGVSSAAVYGLIWRYCANGNGRCWASNKRIARKLGLSKSTVKRSVDKLCDAGWIAVRSAIPDLEPCDDIEHCAMCSIAYPMLDEHHIVPRHGGGSLDPSNTTYLCPNCHRLLHAKATYYVLGKDLDGE